MPQAARQAAYQRILLKISGEALAGSQKFGIEHATCQMIAQSIKEVYDLNIEIGIVVGGGNIFRGALSQEFGFSKTPSDHIGMLATVINGLLLQQCLQSLKVPVQVMNAFNADKIVQPYHWQTAMNFLAKKEVVIFVGGTGNPYFTTDTAAALRASEIGAEVVLKATKVDGIYASDPLINPDSEHFSTISYSEVLAKNLRVMDATAIALCQDNRIPIHVFNLLKKGSLLDAICDKKGGTLVQGE
jgi:uridylate kinase